jgi:hypothetical protein
LITNWPRSASSVAAPAVGLHLSVENKDAFGTERRNPSAAAAKMKTKQVNTIAVIQACAYTAAVEMVHKLPANLLAALMAANNRVLKAAIIESGGELLISSKSVYEMLGNGEHVIASTEKNGALRLSLSSKQHLDENNSEILAL